MALIRPLTEIANKGKTVTPGRANIYKKNVENPLKNWEQETLAASERRNEGILAAVADGRIDRGIQKAGQAKWQKETATKGPTRWSEGVRLGEANYQAGFAPFHEVIQNTDPGPRFAKGDPRNFDRSKTIGMALHAKKISG